jgi:hypothetical protein
MSETMRWCYLDNLPDSVQEEEIRECIAMGMARGEDECAEILVRYYPEIPPTDGLEPGTSAWLKAAGGIDITCIGDCRRRFLMPGGRERVATDRMVITYELEDDRPERTQFP